MTPDSAYRQLKKFLAEAGLLNIRFYNLRHTCAIIFAQNQPIIGRFSHIHRHCFIVYAQHTDEKTVKEAQKSCFWFARDIKG
jgi:integrase